jgi:hypothetical protein
MYGVSHKHRLTAYYFNPKGAQRVEIKLNIMHLTASWLNADIVSKRTPVEFESNPVRRITVEYYYSSAGIPEEIYYEIILLVVDIFNEAVRAIALADIECQNAVEVRIANKHIAAITLGKEIYLRTGKIMPQVLNYRRTQKHIANCAWLYNEYLMYFFPVESHLLYVFKYDKIIFFWLRGSSFGVILFFRKLAMIVKRTFAA